MTSYLPPYSLPIIEPTVDLIKDGAEVSSLAGDINALATAMNAALATVLAGASFYQRTLVATDLLDGLKSGVYGITNGTIATALGLPSPRPGALTTVSVGTSGALTRVFQSIEASGTKLFLQSRISGITSGWSEVPSSVFWHDTALTATSDLATLSAGAYFVSNTVVARALGLPRERPGIFTKYPVGDGSIQTFTSIEDDDVAPMEFKRSRTLAGVDQAWGPAGGASDGGASASGPARRQLLQQALTARKGKMGTGGKGVVALRFDDAHDDFVAKPLPVLVQKAFPFTRVTTSEFIGADPVSPSAFPAMQSYCIQHGGEVWVHGTDHLDAVGDEAIYANLIGSLLDLRAAMPRLPVDCFAPPGGSGISYDGHMPSATTENWVDTYAGLVLLEHFALASGYFENSYYRPLDGVLRDGQIHYSVDAYTLAQAKTLIDRARDWKVGIVMMWHSNNIGAAGYMSLADFTATMDYLAARRDAGDVMVLTKSGLAVADISTSHRDDILTATSGNPYSATILYPQYRQNIPGSTRELTATITGAVGATVTSVVGESTKTHTIPAGGTLLLRHPATIPTDATALTVSIDANTTNAHLYAV